MRVTRARRSADRVTVRAAGQSAKTLELRRTSVRRSGFDQRRPWQPL